jgi:hypothetical protein
MIGAGNQPGAVFLCFSVVRVDVGSVHLFFVSSSLVLVVFDYI